MRKDDAVCLRAPRQAGISYAVWSHGTDGHVFRQCNPPVNSGFYNNSDGFLNTLIDTV